MFYHIYCDSSIEPYNPHGILAWAFIVKQYENIIHQDVAISGYGQGMTNNLGETQAVLAAIKWLVKLPKEKQNPAIIYSDSKLIINQCMKVYACNAPNLIPLQNLIQRARDMYPLSIIFRWVPREKNTEADALSRTLYTEKALKLAKERYLDFVHGNDDIPF